MRLGQRGDDRPTFRVAASRVASLPYTTKPAAIAHSGLAVCLPERLDGVLFKNNPGSDLLSHTPAHAVPSAVAGLTSVFGMGTGGTLPL